MNGEVTLLVRIKTEYALGEVAEWVCGISEENTVLDKYCTRVSFAPVVIAVICSFLIFRYF